MISLALALALAPNLVQSPATGGSPSDQARPVESSAKNTPAAAPQRDRVDAGAAAAQAGADLVSYAELDQLLLDRHAMSPAAEQALAFLSQNALIMHLSAAAGIAISDAAVEARWTELDRLTAEQGIEGGLAGHLDRSGVDRADFLHALRNQLALAELTRRALGLPADRPVPERDQQIWLDQQVAARELEALARPWTNDVVARLGEIEIKGADLAVRLRDTLGPEQVRDALFQLMLCKRVAAACVDLPESVRTAAVELEVSRRRLEMESDQRFRGVGFEALLRAQGMDPATYGNDPAVRIAALSTLIIDTRYDGAALRAAYDAERQWYDDHFGESIEAYLIFAVTAEKPSATVPFTRATARAKLAEVAATIDSEPAFAATAAQLHQEQDNGIVASGLGAVFRGHPRIDAELRGTVFRLYTEGVRGTSAPVELSSGIGLFYIGEHRATPNWEGMRPAVHNELRRRFLVGALEVSQFATYLDPRPQ